MEVKYDSASPEDIASIVDMKIEMFREFGYDQYLHENAREIIFEDYSRMSVSYTHLTLPTICSV